uniref:Uncharacterized protein n=1 Tax=Anopheles dirus TaxID=7168 RepID=A0A182NEC4_9DIPT
MGSMKGSSVSETLRQHMGGWTTAAANAKQNGLSATTSPERLRGTTHDLFELLERVQCSRLDDQRCVLPSYFTQDPGAAEEVLEDSLSLLERKGVGTTDL